MKTSTVTVRQLIAADAGFSELLRAPGLSVLTHFKIDALMRSLVAPMGAAIKQRNTLIEKYGEPDGNGNTSVKQEMLPNFIAEITPLMEHAVEVQFEPLEAELISGVVLSSHEAFTGLAPFLTFKSSEENGS